MSPGSDESPARPVRVWDLPLRLWHWAMVAALSVSLYTGLSGQIRHFDLHEMSGYTVIGLLFFRLGWGLWGGIHARWTRYATTPARMLAYLRGRHDPHEPHTPPGALMAVALCLAAAVQAGSGLFASDDIFNRGPLARHLSDEGVRQATWIHVRAFWAILVLVSVHIVAIAGYWILLRDRLALSMITGRKAFAGEATPNLLLRALATALAAAWLTRQVITY